MRYHVCSRTIPKIASILYIPDSIAIVASSICMSLGLWLEPSIFFSPFKWYNYYNNRASPDLALDRICRRRNIVDLKSLMTGLICHSVNPGEWPQGWWCRLQLYLYASESSSQSKKIEKQHLGRTVGMPLLVAQGWPRGLVGSVSQTGQSLLCLPVVHNHTGKHAVVNSR